jgi:hypothetical protein
MRARNRIPFGRHPLPMLLGAFVVVGFLAAIFVVGPGGVFHFLFSFLLPMALILLVVVGTIGFMVQGGAKVLDGRDAPPSKNTGNPPRGEGLSNPMYWLPSENASSPHRGEGLSNPVYWLLMSLFLLASVAMVCFFWLIIRDQWIHHRLLVAGRFDEGETLRMVFVLLASVAVSSGLLWRHYRRIDSYGSPLETVFMAVFTLCAALAAVTVLPALFAS